MLSTVMKTFLRSFVRVVKKTDTILGILRRKEFNIGIKCLQNYWMALKSKRQKKLSLTFCLLQILRESGSYCFCLDRKTQRTCSMKGDVALNRETSKGTEKLSNVCSQRAPEYLLSALIL